MGSLFFPVLPVFAANEIPQTPLRSVCFQGPECKAAPYEGTPVESSECKAQEKAWVDAGYIFECHASDPTVQLQIPIGIGSTKITGLGNYIRRLYTYLIGISGVVAGLIIVWAGVTWLTSGGNPEHISSAKQKMGNAFVGLFLILGSYVILQTVNPALINLRVPPVKLARQELLGEEKCKKRQEYPCAGTPLVQPLQRTAAGLWSAGARHSYAKEGGIYGCDDTSIPKLIENPPCQQGVRPGQCRAQFCPQGAGGCYTLLKGRIREDALTKLNALAGDTLANMRAAGAPLLGSITTQAEGQVLLRKFLDDVEEGAYVCVDKSACGGCSDTVKWGACVSSACNCTLGILTTSATSTNTERVACMPPAGGGTECVDDSTCASGICNTGPISDVCGPSQDGTLCNRHADCESGLCNTSELITLQLGFSSGRCVGEHSVGGNDDCVIVSGREMCEPGFHCATNPLRNLVADPECVPNT